MRHTTWNSVKHCTSLHSRPARLAERVWCTKLQSSLLNIYFLLSGLQSSLLPVYFRDGPNRSVFTLHHSKTQTLSHMWWSTFEIGAAQLRSVKEITPSQPFLCVNRSPTHYDFCGGAKAIRYSVNISLKEQYPVTAHAPNFDFWTGCREIKRWEESKRTLKNLFASRLAGFNTRIKLLRIADQWHIVPVEFRFGQNLDFMALLLLPLASQRTKRLEANRCRLKAYFFC